MEVVVFPSCVADFDLVMAVVEEASFEAAAVVASFPFEAALEAASEFLEVAMVVVEEVACLEKLPEQQE